MTDRVIGADARRAALATGLFALVMAELASVVIGWAVVGMSFTLARDTFVVSNTAIGVCCAVCGVLIARHRPGNRLGWLLLGAGICQTGTAAVTPWLVEAIVTDAPIAVTRWLATLYDVAWPWSVALFIPLALLHFPDGRLPGTAWRAAALMAFVNAPVQVLLFSADPNPLATAPELAVPDDGRTLSWLAVPRLAVQDTLWIVSDAVLSAGFLGGLVLLAVRYRRGDDRTRQQLLWLILALAVALVILVGERQFPGPLEDRDFPILVTAVIALVPIAMTIAVLRHGLLDIRMVWSRAVTYALLTAGVVVIYLLLVNVGESLLRQEVGLGTSVVATLVVAAGFNPVRVRLQRGVDRLLYGERSDPVRAAASVTAQLAAGAERPADVLPALCHALRLPYAALSDGAGTVGEHGTPTELVEVVALRHAGERVGELRVGVRSGQRRLDPADRAVLELMAVPIGVAVRADQLSAQVQRSRRAIVTAREEERRRLRRDLHDGLGPVLTGIAFQADAVVNLAAVDPGEVRELGDRIRGSATGAIAEVRRLIYELRPAALDELGLVEALRRHVEQCSRRADGGALAVSVTAPERLPELPAAVEVAAYRIVTEALTNVARHSQATAAEIVVALGPDGTLTLHVRDDGAPTGGWTAGIGLASMRERAVELGGTFAAEPTPGGGLVAARLPVDVAVPA